MSYEAAIEKTLARGLTDGSLIAALPFTPAHIFVRRDGILCDVRQAVADASPNNVFSVLTRLGGSNGYLYANRLWRIRGWLDRYLGGIGMQPSVGREPLKKNDHVDFWHVQDLEPDRRLLLGADMKLPGHACLEFLLSPQPDARTLVRCCAWFEPRGLLGELYWWVLYPVHILIFRGMVRAVCKKAASNPATLSATAGVR